MDLQLLRFMENIRCPLTGGGLKVLTSEDLNKINRAIEAGRAVTYEGKAVREPLEGGVISAYGRFIYPVIGGYLLCLLVTDANQATEFVLTDTLAQSAIEDKNKVGLADGKKMVQQFYDEYGWQISEEGYKDTLTFEYRRPVEENYWSKCHLRLNNYLPGGKYILDVASGSIPNDEYLTFCQKYEAKVCIDFSIQALKEATIHLNGRGIFILGDMTNLPLEDGCIDSVISMHTVYHVPQEEQTKAVGEACRVLNQGGVAVIVYS